MLDPHPQHLEVSAPGLETTGFTRPYWLYVVAVGLLGAGFADFPLIAFHFGKTAVLPSDWIPLFYAVAMGVDVVAALVLGRLFRPTGNAGHYGDCGSVGLFCSPGFFRRF